MQNTSITLKINAWIVVLLLVITNIVSLVLWQPWDTTSSGAKRTIQMTGEAKMQATPDQYNFFPYFEVKDASTTEASKKLSQKTNEVVAKLKELGVKEEQIKTTQNNYTAYPVRDTQATVSFTIKISDKDLAQKIQDYLQSTDAKGALTPQADFADATRKKYEAELRDKALADAKEKAAQSAKTLGASLGKVVTIQDSQTGIVFPMAKEGLVDSSSSVVSTPLLTGLNDLQYSVQVTYSLR